MKKRLIVAHASLFAFCVIAELEGGVIEICGGFMGPVLFSIPLQSLQPNTKNAADAAGLVFFGISEFNGKWRCRSLEKFCKAELPSLMEVAKAREQEEMIFLNIPPQNLVALILFNVEQLHFTPLAFSSCDFM